MVDIYTGKYIRVEKDKIGYFICAGYTGHANMMGFLEYKTLSKEEALEVLKRLKEEVEKAIKVISQQ